MSGDPRFTRQLVDDVHRVLSRHGFDRGDHAAVLAVLLRMAGLDPDPESHAARRGVAGSGRGARAGGTGAVRASGRPGRAAQRWVPPS